MAGDIKGKQINPGIKLQEILETGPLNRGRVGVKGQVEESLVLDCEAQLYIDNIPWRVAQSPQTFQSLFIYLFKNFKFIFCCIILYCNKIA